MAAPASTTRIPPVISNVRREGCLRGRKAAPINRAARSGAVGFGASGGALATGRGSALGALAVIPRRSATPPPPFGDSIISTSLAIISPRRSLGLALPYQG